MPEPAVVSVTRRAFMCASLAAAALGMSRPAHALTAVPRQRVILDNDFSGDPDGLFQLAHHRRRRRSRFPS